MEEKKRRVYPSAAQKVRLVTCVEADEELRNGKFSASFTKKISESRWKAIAAEVNSVPGAHKTWIEWRKTWQDMKSCTKRKNTVIRRSQNLTGGGPPAPELTEEDKNILSTMSEASLIGHQDSQESLVEFTDLQSPAVRLLTPPLIILEVQSITLTEKDANTIMLEDQTNIPQKEKDSKGTKKGKKKLQQSLEVAEALKGALEEKNQIK